MPSAAKWPGELRPKEWTKAALRPILGRNNSSTQEFTASEEPFLQNKTADSVKPTQAKQGGKGTFSSSVFLLFNSAVGAGVLALPYCFVVGGILPTTIAIVFFAIITGLSSVAIVACQEASNSRDYQTIVKYYLGQTASSVMSAILATYCLLNSVGALVIIADQSGPVLKHFFGKQDVWWMQRETHVLVGGMLAFPLMCLREITSLKFTAMLSLAGMMFIVCCVIQYTVTSSPEEQEANGEVEFFGPSWASLLLALPSACLSYQNQMQVPNIYAELRPELKNVRTMSLIVFASKCIILPMYLATAFAGYYMFRGQTPPDILIAPYDSGAVQIFVARMLLCVNAVFRVPVNHFTARSALYTLWQRFGGKKSSESETTFSGSLFWIELLTYSAIMLGLACMLTTLDVVLDIMSATCAMAVMFFIPGAFLLKGEGFTGGWRVLAFAFMIVGAALAVVSAGDTIVKIASGQA